MMTAAIAAVGFRRPRSINTARRSQPGTVCRPTCWQLCSPI